MTTIKRQTFSPEFKREAVRLMEQGDKEASQLARELGIKRNQLYKWKAEIDTHGNEAFPGHGGRPRKVNTDNTASLKAENKRLREENEIFKRGSEHTCST